MWDLIDNKLEIDYNRFLEHRDKEYEKLDREIKNTPIVKIGDRISDTKRQPLLAASQYGTRVNIQEIEKVLRTFELETRDSSNFFRSISNFDDTFLREILKRADNSTENAFYKEVASDRYDERVKTDSEIINNYIQNRGKWSIRKIDKNVFDNQMLTDYVIASKAFCFMNQTYQIARDEDGVINSNINETFQKSFCCPTDIKNLVLQKKEITKEDVTKWVNDLKTVRDKYHLNEFEFSALAANQLTNIKSENLSEVFGKYEIISGILNLEGINKTIFDNRLCQKFYVMDTFEIYYLSEVFSERKNHQSPKPKDYLPPLIDFCLGITKELLKNECPMTAERLINRLSNITSRLPELSKTDIENISITDYFKGEKNKKECFSKMTPEKLITAICTKEKYNPDMIDIEWLKKIESAKIINLYRNINNRETGELSIKPENYLKEGLYYPEFEEMEYEKELLYEVMGRQLIELESRINNEEYEKSKEILCEDLYLVYLSPDNIMNLLPTLDEKCCGRFYGILEYLYPNNDFSNFKDIYGFDIDEAIESYLGAGGSLDELEKVEIQLEKINNKSR